MDCQRQFRRPPPEPEIGPKSRSSLDLEPRSANPLASSSKGAPKPKPSTPEIEVVSESINPRSVQRPKGTAAGPLQEELVDWDYLNSRKVEVYDRTGSRVYPRHRLRLGSKSFISIDFHQVLDVHREFRKAVYPIEGEYGVPEINRKVLRKIVELGFVPIVCSYVHSNWRRDSVRQSCATIPEVEYTVITREPTGAGGKADTLLRLLSFGVGRGCTHIDDKKEICQEFKGKRTEQPFLGIAHVQVPRKKSAPEGVRSYKSLTLVIASLEQELLAIQAAQGRRH